MIVQTLTEQLFVFIYLAYRVYSTTDYIIAM